MPSVAISRKGCIALVVFLACFQREVTLPFTHPRPRLATATTADHTYPEFDDDLNPSISPNNNNLTNANTLIHIGEFGLGHRLLKMSSAWHLTKTLNLTRMKLNWGDCSGEGNIFPELFGSDYIDVPGSDEQQLAKMRTRALENTDKTIKVVNDVLGYYAGQNYKDHRVPLAQRYKDDDSPFLDKLHSDLQFYRMIRQRFLGKQDVIRFMDEHNFRDHFVIGLHLRLGNSEGDNFQNLGRGVNNEFEFIFNLVDLIRSFLDDMQQSSLRGRFVDEVGHQRPPLIFLATDTQKYIALIANITRSHSIETVVVPQMRVDKGVTFELHKGAQCTQGWRDMLLDNILLSFSDVLIAARYSSFTQSLPMKLVFDRGRGNHGPHFCEVSDNAKQMTCLEDIRTWLFRDDTRKIFHYTIADGGENSHAKNADVAVVHSLRVHLPDVRPSGPYSAAVKFLNLSYNTSSKTLQYGGRFDMRFRRELACPGCVDFTFK